MYSRGRRGFSWSIHSMYVDERWNLERSCRGLPKIYWSEITERAPSLEAVAIASLMDCWSRKMRVAWDVCGLASKISWAHQVKEAHQARKAEMNGILHEQKQLVKTERSSLKPITAQVKVMGYSVCWWVVIDQMLLRMSLKLKKEGPYRAREFKIWTISYQIQCREWNGKKQRW